MGQPVTAGEVATGTAGATTAASTAASSGGTTGGAGILDQRDVVGAEPGFLAAFATFTTFATFAAVLGGGRSALERRGGLVAAFATFVATSFATFLTFVAAVLAGARLATGEGSDGRRIHRPALGTPLVTDTVNVAFGLIGSTRPGMEPWPLFS